MNNQSIGDAETNPYLALREAKIARNHARLKELGLLFSGNDKVVAAKKPPSALQKATKKRLSGSEKSASPPLSFTPVTVRRSRRISQQSEEQDGRFSQKLESEKDTELDPTVSRQAKRPRASASSLKGTDNTRTAALPALPAAPNSVRSIDLDPELLVIGNDTVNGLLGVTLEKTGKEFVIHESFSRAASLEDQDRLQSSRLSFNKYSGVQEWRNVIFLWINLGAPNNTLVNEFLDDGRQITWFGGSRMYDDTPVVQKLMKMGQGVASSAETTSPSSQLILWCRLYNRDKKSFQPYTCLGRLSYNSHVPGSYPISFIWNLMDYEKLIDSSNNIVRETFKQFLKTV